MKIDKIVNFFTFENSEMNILGSYNDSRLKYYSDIDLESHIHYNHKTLKPLVNFFKSIYNSALDKKIYITDLKAGFYNGVALKWTKDEVNQGYKEIDKNIRVHFYEIFTQKSIIKYDWICLLDGIYTEFSCNYYIHFATYDTQPISYNELAIAFYIDYNKYMKEQMFFKAIKRLYKFFVEIKDKVNINRIVKFLNTKVGFYSYVVSHLETLKDLINLDETIPIVNLKKSIKSLLIDTEFEKYTTRLTEKKNIILLINTIINMLTPKINKASIDFLHQKIKSKDIILELYKHEY